MTPSDSQGSKIGG